MITPGAFSAGGDSGSLIVTDDGNNDPVALLFAGSSTHTIANLIGPVLTRFSVTIDNSPPPDPVATGTITGTVTNTADGLPIGGATVLVEDTGESDTTAADGKYMIPDVSVGNHDVTASAAAFISTTLVGVIVIDGGITDADFALDPEPPPPDVGTVSVSCINYDTQGGPNGDKHLKVTVALVDDLGSLVAGASVSIDLFRDAIPVLSDTGTTGTDGTVMFTLNNAASGLYTTTVTDVQAAGLTWDLVTPFNEFLK